MSFKFIKAQIRPFTVAILLKKFKLSIRFFFHVKKGMKAFFCKERQLCCTKLENTIQERKKRINMVIKERKKVIQHGY